MSVLDVQCYASGEVRCSVVIFVVISICLIELSVHLYNFTFPHCRPDSPCCDTVSVHPTLYFFTHVFTVFSRHFRCGIYTRTAGGILDNVFHGSHNWRFEKDRPNSALNWKRFDSITDCRSRSSECHSDKGCVGPVGAPERLAVPNASVAGLSSAQALDSREISLLLPRGSVVDEYSRSAFCNEEFGVWTVCEMADRRTPGAVYKYWALGRDRCCGRDQFDVGDCGLAEIRLTNVPTVCQGSFLPMCLQLVGDQFFQCAFSLSEIDLCF